MQNQDNDEFVFLPLGGAGEIGMNLNLYGLGPKGKWQWLMLDCGVSFGDGIGAATLGVDAVLPDPAWIADRADDLLAMVLTHGHEDHIGAVALLWDRLRCPLYATPFTAALLKRKLSEFDLTDEVDLHILPLGGRVSIGPFDIELVSLTHSIPEPNAVVLRTSLGTVMHTGDWKLDPDPLTGEPTDEAALRALGDSGVLAMVCDSTNVFVEGESGSEADVRRELISLIGEQEGRVAVTCFASNVARLQSVMIAARENNKVVVVVGRAMHNMLAAARETGFLDDSFSFLTEKQAANRDDGDLLYLVTGSQGQPRAALDRISRGDHPQIELGQGDTVIFSSRVIPGNEVPIAELQGRLRKRGIGIVTDRESAIHVSGHPCRGELTRMYQWVRPQICIPVHGTHAHLAEHGKLAAALQVPDVLVIENGLMSRIAPGKPEVIERVHSGRLFLDGKLVVHGEEVSARGKLAASGVVGVTIVLDKTGRQIIPPVVLAEGVPDQILDVIEDEIEYLAKQAVGKGLANGTENDASETLRKALRRLIQDEWGKRPIVKVSIVRGA